MIIKVINQNNVAEEKDITLNDVEYLSDLKANRLIGANKNVYRLTAKCYTEIKRQYAKGR